MKSNFTTAVFSLLVFLSIGSYHVTAQVIAAIATQKQKTTPFDMRLPHTFIFGFEGSIKISGVPKCNPERISVWLVYGSDYQGNATNCPLQVDINFKDTEDSNFVVVGSTSDGVRNPATMQLRQRQNPDFPIDSVGFFNIDINVKPSTFVVRFDDMEVEYRHRMFHTKPMHLVILHDAWITKIVAKMIVYY